jgi:glycine cleavage system H protein
MVPADCRYAKSHEWVKVDGSVATIGITDHAQDALGDITFAELPRLGAKVAKGGECGVIESVKAASDIYSPISGEVAEINRGLEAAPELINKDPHGSGWFFKLKNVNPAELADLMDAAGYQAFLETQA